jgi:hypothetical protein
VTQVPEFETFADVVGPTFEVRRVDLDGRAALSTRKVMVVRFDDAAPVETLTAISHDHVDVAKLDQLLELGVDGRERDAAAVALDEGM